MSKPNKYDALRDFPVGTEVKVNDLYNGSVSSVTKTGMLKVYILEIDRHLLANPERVIKL